jgi:ATP-dependent RNA helicase DHX57
MQDEGGRSKEEEEGCRMQEEGGRRKEEGGRRKEEGGRRKEEGGRNTVGNSFYFFRKFSQTPN